MKKNIIGIISGASAFIFGLLVALGPQFLFKGCMIHHDSVPTCFWALRAELCTGLIIAALGICFIIFSDLRTHTGLLIGVFLTGIVALFIPYLLIGGCEGAEMACRRIAFPVLTVLCAVILIGAVVNIIYIDKKAKS
jgi:hypothetical protein